MIKRYTLLCWIVLLSISFLSSCSSKPKYSWKPYSLDEVKNSYANGADSFEQITSLLYSDEFWNTMRRDEEAGHAWVMDPYDDRLETLDESTQTVIRDFFQKYSPYMVSVDYQKYITITFINEDRTDGYSMFSYSKEKEGLEDYCVYIKAHYEHLESLGGDWFLYY